MGWSWTGAIERNREALLRIVAALFALAGLANDGTMPRHLRNYLRRILRPAESAVRRLIVLAARGLTIELGPLRPVVPGTALKSRCVKPDTKGGACAFPILDSLKDFRPRRRYSRWIPRVTWLGLTEPRPLPPAPGPDDPVDARRLVRRLGALKAVLDDLDRHARRLARWQARRDCAPADARRFVVLRPGFPPGRRKRPVHEVDEVLRECQRLVLMADNTS